MKLTFDKRKFNENAPANVKRTLKSHVDVLDGMEVDFTNDHYHGTIPSYQIGNDEFYLFPVMKGWCSNERQMDLFEGERS